MIIYPAIDLKNQKCVRLYKGDFSKEEIFNDSPLDQAQQFEKLGFQNLHIVDLDRTLSSNNTNLNSIKEIAKNTSLKIQVGGGLRTLENIEEVLRLGVENVVMGTAAAVPITTFSTPNLKTSSMFSKVLNPPPTWIFKEVFFAISFIEFKFVLLELNVLSRSTMCKF